MSRILIVDDHDSIREVYSDLLPNHAIDFVEAADHAVQYASCTAYGLVIMDIALKGASGITAALALRGLGYAGPIIAVTGGLVSMDEALMKRAGFAETVMKPAIIREFRRIVMQYLSDSAK